MSLRRSTLCSLSAAVLAAAAGLAPAVGQQNDMLNVAPSDHGRRLGAERHYLAGMGINGIAVADFNGKPTLIVANGGAVLTSPAVNHGTLASNAEVNTGGITVLTFPNPAATITNLSGTLTATLPNPGYGRTFTLTAALTPPLGSPDATGTVTFSIDNTPLTPASAITGNTATFTVSTPAYAVGVHTITAAYSGDAAYNPLTLTGSFTVTLLPSQTKMTDVVTPIHYGEIIGDIAKGFASALDPTDSALLDGGNLVFFIDGQLVCTLPVISGITQTCPSSTGAGYSVGTYTISAAYQGNHFYSPSVSPGYTVQIVPDDPTGAVSSSSNPAFVGAPVTLTASFTNPFATPSGTVTFFDGNTPIGSGTLNSSGIAALSTSTLALGTHAITAVLASSLNFNGATTPVQQQFIITPPVTTSTQLTSSLNPSTVGQGVTFTARVIPSSGSSLVPAGNVTFTADTVLLGSVPLDATGSARVALSTLALGSHTIVAAYAGFSAPTSTSFLPSAATLIQQVNPVPGFTLTVTPTSLRVPIGNYAPTQVTITSINGFHQPVALSCSGLPRGVTCTVRH
jgi:hypothetical protein